MSPEFPFKGPPRRVFLFPFLAGLALMVFSVLLLFYPLAVVLILLKIGVAVGAICLFLAGLGLTLFGLDLWRGVSGWHKHLRFDRCCDWFGAHRHGPEHEDEDV